MRELIKMFVVLTVLCSFSGGLLAGLHARLMREMRDFVHRHGASAPPEAARVEEIERLVREIPLEEFTHAN